MSKARKKNKKTLWYIPLNACFIHPACIHVRTKIMLDSCEYVRTPKYVVTVETVLEAAFFAADFCAGTGVSTGPGGVFLF